uniref:Oxa-1 n=1 Tax=Pristionchus pacificus TaxID=54126 RepID=A0A2A6BU69_PRIPA|eukprot:PDM69454.1 oxa-1 [Pristionchus pacificus]
MSQRLVAKQSKYKKELDEFRERQEDARREGNNMLVQQIFLEQRDFLKSKDIKLGRQFLVLLANGGVFMTQFFAIKRMIEVNYPGLSTGGTMWFTDLTLADPYYILPLISAGTMAVVSRVGIEMGQSTDTMPPAMRLGMLYGLPVVIFGVSSQFGSGLCIYWCASNAVSLAYAVLFRIEAVRKMFNIPPVVRYDTPKKNPWKEFMNNRNASKQVPPSLSDLKTRDADKFKKAGRGKPIL